MAAKAPQTHPCECSRWAILVDDTERTDLGCTATTAGRFAPGHDAKLKGMLVRANIAGQALVRTDDQGQTDKMDVAQALTNHFPKWTTRVNKSTTSATADADRKQRRAAARANRPTRVRTRPEPVEPRACSCGQRAMPGSEVCAACRLSDSLANLAARHCATDIAQGVQPEPLPDGTPISNRQRVVGIQKIEIPEAEVALVTVRQDSEFWWVACAGGCERAIRVPKRVLQPVRCTEPTGDHIELRYSAPGTRVCGVCEPNWPTPA